MRSSMMPFGVRNIEDVEEMQRAFDLTRSTGLQGVALQDRAPKRANFPVLKRFFYCVKPFAQIFGLCQRENRTYGSKGHASSPESGGARRVNLSYSFKDRPDGRDWN